MAGRENLQSLYDHLNTVIRSVDENTLIFYEPVTWSVFVASQEAGTGFSGVPGGPESVVTACFLMIMIVVVAAAVSYTHLTLPTNREV